MKIAVCDDEEYFRNQIKKALTQVEYEANIDTFSNGTDLIADMRQKKYDIVYLDIEMPGLNGIEAAEKLQQINCHVIIIFVSSYTCYISKAFIVNAFQFLIKDNAHEADIISEYRRAKERYQKEHFLYTIKKNGNIIGIETNQIVYIESLNRHLFVNTCDGLCYEFRSKLDKEAEKLQPFYFLRIHESYLINMAYIKTLNSDNVTLKQIQKEFPISRKHKENVIRLYNLFSAGCSV